MIRSWWFSTEKMTVLVETENEIIIDAAPIVKKFTGQPIQNLRNWLQKQHRYKEYEMTATATEDQTETTEEETKIGEGEPLWVKYRPKTFDGSGDEHAIYGIVGQDHVVNALDGMLSSPTCPRFFIFVGPPGTGKTTFARALARRVGIENPESITGDYREIDAAVDGNIDALRELTDFMNISPMRGKFKIVCIDEIQTISSTGWDALLKSTEKPPKHAIWIFCTTELGKIKEAIMTRATPFHLKKIDAETLLTVADYVNAQEGFDLSEEFLKVICTEADGSMRQMLNYLSLIRSVKSIEEIRDLIANSSIEGVDEELRTIMQMLSRGEPNYEAYMQVIPRVQKFGAMKLLMKIYFAKSIIHKKDLIYSKIMDAVDKMNPFPSEKEAPFDLSLMLRRALF